MHPRFPNVVMDSIFKKYCKILYEQPLIFRSTCESLGRVFDNTNPEARKSKGVKKVAKLAELAIVINQK